MSGTGRFSIQYADETVAFAIQILRQPGIWMVLCRRNLQADVLGEMDQLSVTYTIEDQLAEKELLEIINDFLGKMNAEDRDIFVRRYWFFDSVAAIAKRHVVSVGSVKMNLYRSRKKLLKVLKKEGKHL